MDTIQIKIKDMDNCILLGIKTKKDENIFLNIFV